MKLLYIFDTRFNIFNPKEQTCVFKYWCYSLQDIINNKKSRDIKLWLVSINLLDYLELLQFSDTFDYENINTAIEKISYYFQLNNNAKQEKIYNADSLLTFLRNSENTFKIRGCNKIVILSCNIHTWVDQVSELKIIGDLFHTYSCQFHFVNVDNKSQISTIKQIEQMSCYLEKYANFFFKNIELNKINILQISKEILSVKFPVSLTLSLKKELLLKCEGIPLINEISHSAYIALNTFSIEFDIRAKALKDGISQHLIYGIPIFLSNKSNCKNNEISLASLAQKLSEKNHVLILRSNLHPVDLKIHEKDVRFLWVGVPLIKGESSITLCLHGLATQETYSLEIEENFSSINDYSISNSDIKLNDIFNFLILIDEFNPLEYSNERLEYSFRNLKNSKIDILNKWKRSRRRNKKNSDFITKAKINNILREDKITKYTKATQKREILDPQSILINNSNEDCQKK